MQKFALQLGFAAVFTVALSAANYEFIQTWKSPFVGPLDFAGKKVVALVITDDLSLRMSAEEALAREITARGPVASASYRLIPKEELKDKDKARNWFEKAGIEGVVALRLVDVQKEKRYSTVVYTSGYYNNFYTTGYYNNFYDYYGYGWTSVIPIGDPKIDTILAVETVIYTIKDGKLIWAGTSETTNPKDVASYIKGLVKAVGNELKKANLVKK